MSAFTESYVLRVLLAPRHPVCGPDAVNRLWRWLRNTLSDNHRPELLQQVRRRSQTAPLPERSGEAKNEDRSSMADFVRILRAACDGEIRSSDPSPGK
jgi:hypothetical protein